MIKSSTRSVILWAGVLLLSLGCLGVACFRDTLGGIWSGRFARWEEDRFKGKPLSELRESFQKQGRELSSVGETGFTGNTGHTLTQKQRLMRFVKGREYRWFTFGTANNVGYVVIETRLEGDIVVDIVRSIDIDSP